MSVQSLRADLNHLLQHDEGIDLQVECEDSEQGCFSITCETLTAEDVAAKEAARKDSTETESDISDADSDNSEADSDNSDTVQHRKLLGEFSCQSLNTNTPCSKPVKTQKDYLKERYYKIGIGK